MKDDDPRDKIGTVPENPFWPVGAVVLSLAVVLFAFLWVLFSVLD